MNQQALVERVGAGFQKTSEAWMPRPSLQGCIHGGFLKACSQPPGGSVKGGA